MVSFANSDYNIAQKRYEDKLAEAHASDQESRANDRKLLEDQLVKEGQESINNYIKLLDYRWTQARCLAEYDGINIGYNIAANAQRKLIEKNK